MGGAEIADWSAAPVPSPGARRPTAGPVVPRHPAPPPKTDDDGAAAARRPTTAAADGLILSGLAVSAHRPRFTHTFSSRSAAAAAHNIFCLE